MREALPDKYFRFIRTWPRWGCCGQAEASGRGWLGMEDSNLRYLIQSQASYR